MLVKLNLSLDFGKKKKNEPKLYKNISKSNLDMILSDTTPNIIVLEPSHSEVVMDQFKLRLPVRLIVNNGFVPKS